MAHISLHSVSAIQDLLKSSRYETARRVCQRALRDELAPAARSEMLLLLHSANRFLGDFVAATAALNQIESQNSAQELELLLCRAEDADAVAEHGFYRASPEAKAGLTAEEYSEGKEKLAREWFEKSGRARLRRPTSARFKTRGAS